MTEISRDTYLDGVEQELVDLMVESIPREICGFLVERSDGRLAILEVANVSPTPNEYFAMDASQLVSAYASEHLVAVWHSHPHGPDQPSGVDKQHADPRLRYLLVTIDGLSEWDTVTWARIR